VLAKLRLKRDKTSAGQSSSSESTSGRTYDFNKWRNDRLRSVQMSILVFVEKCRLTRIYSRNFLELISVDLLHLWAA